jgi:thioredoxin reductase
VKEGIGFKLFERKWVGGLLYYANRVDNLLGHQGKSGVQLSMEFSEHLRQMGVEVVHEEVKGIQVQDDGFLVNDELFSHVILATGSRPNTLKIPKALYFIENPGALKGKELLIVGGGDLAYDNALRATGNGANVTIMMRSGPKANRSLLEEVRSKGVKELTGDPKGIMYNGETYRFGYQRYDTLAIFIGRSPDLSLVEHLGDLDIEMPDFTTSIKGLYVVGDAALGTVSQTALASGSGLAAAMHIARTVRSR